MSPDFWRQFGFGPVVVIGFGFLCGGFGSEARGVVEDDLGGAEAVIIHRVLEDVGENIGGAFGEGVGALVGGGLAVCQCFGEGGLEVGVGVSPVPDGFGGDADLVGDAGREHVHFTCSVCVAAI
jgi:hypothetical protein